MSLRTIFAPRMRPTLTSLLSPAVLLFLMTACSNKGPEVVPEVSVQVAPARTGDISEIVTAEAVVYPLQQAVVAPKISSTIKSFPVQRGAHVRKGQLLAVLENADLSAAAVQSKGEYEQAEAGYVTSTAASIPQQIQKAELDAASSKAAADAQQKIVDSRRELFQQGALPRRELDAAEVALAQARSQYEQSQKQLDDLRRVGREQAIKTAGGQLSAAKGKLLGAQAQLSYSQIRSPIDGVVTDRPLYPGELASANQPLLTVMNTSRLIAKAHISQAQAARLSKGNPASIQIAGQEDAIPAKLSLISPALDPGSTTIEVWIEASKPPAALRPGMTVQISITARTAKNAVLVPTNSVLQTPDGASYVMIAGSEGVAHQKNVQLGIHGITETQVTSGLAAGDSVIISGGYGLPDKTKIKIEASPASEEGASKSGEKPPSSGSEKE
jgi:HlyD family secretion protein